MLLRHHPLFRYRGIPSWPPVWTWESGLENHRPKGEIGILRKVEASNIRPADRCFLYIEHEASSYIGCLLFDDSTFCGYVATLLENHCNRSVKEIGGLDVSHTLHCSRYLAANTHGSLSLISSRLKR